MAGKIGPPVLGTVLMLSWRDEAYYRSDPWRGRLDTEGGGVLVNHGCALFAADVGRDQFAFDRNRREPLIPESDRQFGEFGEIASERARRLRTRALAAIHIDRQAEHESDGGAFGGKDEHALRVGGESPARDGLDARCKFSIGITGGNADGLGAEIKPDEGPAGGQVRDGFNEGQDEGHAQGTVPAGSCSAKSAMFPAVVNHTRSSAWLAMCLIARARCLKRCGQPTT